MSDELKFTCEVCGQEFEPDPDAMVETHLGGECACCDSGMTPEQIQEGIESGEFITGEQLAAMSEYELKENGLTPEDRDKLLKGEEVAVGGMCICKPCQDRMAEEQA